MGANSGRCSTVKRLSFTSSARTDILNAFEWYGNQSDGLGFEFMRCLDAVFRVIERSPYAPPCVFEDYHRALLRRFPCAVFYEVQDDVMVCATFHCAQNPEKLGMRMLKS